MNKKKKLVFGFAVLCFGGVFCRDVCLGGRRGPFSGQIFFSSQPLRDSRRLSAGFLREFPFSEALSNEKAGGVSKPVFRQGIASLSGWLHGRRCEKKNHVVSPPGFHVSAELSQLLFVFCLGVRTSTFQIFLMLR